MSFILFHFKIKFEVKTEPRGSRLISFSLFKTLHYRKEGGCFLSFYFVQNEISLSSIHPAKCPNYNKLIFSNTKLLPPNILILSTERYLSTWGQLRYLMFLLCNHLLLLLSTSVLIKATRGKKPVKM